MVVCPPVYSSVAYTQLRQAIECPDPVIFLEPNRRYWATEAAEPGFDALYSEARADIATACVRRRGSDATVIAYGGLVATALEAAEAGAEHGSDLAVIDLRSLSPFADATVPHAG